MEFLCSECLVCLFVEFLFYDLFFFFIYYEVNMFVIIELNIWGIKLCIVNWIYEELNLYVNVRIFFVDVIFRDFFWFDI